jgi:hypothetical protein
MANTYTLIEAKTIGTAVGSVTFSSIPQTYTDIQVLFCVRTAYADTQEDFKMTVNSTNTTYRRLYGLGSGSPGSLSGSDSLIGFVNANSATADTFGNASAYIPNYASTTTYKSISADSVTENNSTAAGIEFVAAVYSSNTAVTSLTFSSANAANINVGSTFYLYGISNS